MDNHNMESMVSSMGSMEDSVFQNKGMGNNNLA